MRTIAPALALLVGAFSVVVADAVAAVERLSDEVRTVRGADRPLALSDRGNEAVLALLEDAERELRAGRPEQASVALERATLPPVMSNGSLASPSSFQDALVISLGLFGECAALVLRRAGDGDAD